jgi:glycosyltransferase involved in cell wall biosynthesis
MKRALVVHSRFDTFGGAEAYSARVCEILQQHFDEVVILHAGVAPSFDFIDQRSELSLDPARVKFFEVPIPRLLRWLTGPEGDRRALLIYAQVIREARRRMGEFDLVVSTFAECPLQSPHVIQTIHTPLLATDRVSLYYCGVEIHGPRLWLHHLYIQIVRRRMGWSRRRVAERSTVTLSRWVMDQFLRIYPGGNVRPIHMGVRVGISPESPNWIPFERRENNLVIIGRVVPSKRVETAIEIVDGLRAKGHEIGLKIIGQGSGPYIAQIDRLCADRPWVTRHSGLDRTGLETLVASQKWGIHCYHFEHYGLAPAELQALGLITFVHDSGGQREIIGQAQRYADVADAVRKIDAVIRAPETHAELLAQGRAATAIHRVENFQAQFEALAAEVCRAEPAGSLGRAHS